MTTTIGSLAASNNADALGLSAPGMSVEDAAYHTVHSYPGGAPALAQRMGANPNTLQSKVDPKVATHKLSLREALDVMAFSGDDRILHALAAARRYVALPLGASTTSGQTLHDVMQTVREFGEMCAAVNEAVADGSVTQNEMREVERQVGELHSAIDTLLRTLRGMMPRAPL